MPLKDMSKVMVGPGCREIFNVEGVVGRTKQSCLAWVRGGGKGRGFWGRGLHGVPNLKNNN